MDDLPADCARVIEGFCGAKEIGFSLGAASKSWKPDEETWRRLAARNPLTQLAHVMVDWSTWCAELHVMRQPDTKARRLRYRLVKNANRYRSGVGASAINPVPRLVLQILQDGVVKGTKPLDLWFDVHVSFSDPGTGPSDHLSRIQGGADHNVDARYMACRTCARMESGQPITNSLGVRICRGSTFQFRIVALPTDSMDRERIGLHSVLATAPGFAPTIILDRHFSLLRVDTFIQTSRDPRFEGEQRDANPDGSSEWGLVGHHPALRYFPLRASMSPLDSEPFPWDPACIVRLVENADPIIDEFHWDFPSPCLMQIKLNRIRARGAH